MRSTAAEHVSGRRHSRLHRRRSPASEPTVKIRIAPAINAKPRLGLIPAAVRSRQCRGCCGCLLVGCATGLLEPRLRSFPRLLPAAVRGVAEICARARARSAVGHLVAEAHEVAVRASRLLIDPADSRARICRRRATAGAGARRGLRRGLATATTAGAACSRALAGAFAGRHWARGERGEEGVAPGGPTATGGTLSFSNLTFGTRTSIPIFASVPNPAPAD